MLDQGLMEVIVLTRAKSDPAAHLAVLGDSLLDFGHEVVVLVEKLGVFRDRLAVPTDSSEIGFTLTEVLNE